MVQIILLVLVTSHFPGSHFVSKVDCKEMSMKSVKKWTIESEYEAYGYDKLYKDLVDIFTDFQGICYTHNSLVAVGRKGVKARLFLLNFDCFNNVYLY